MGFFHWGPKLSVEAQRKQAEKRLATLAKRGSVLLPVVVEGRKIAGSFWGKAWCDNLERYSDYANRLPRGRSYVRHRCVIDLQIAEGEITAKVSGSSIYRIRITVAPLDGETWNDICQDCAGNIDSMVELLQGRLSKAVMDRVCRMGDGLFPSPKDIGLACSCPDGAAMCKHVAAALYGVGARLDRCPELLFLLRGVDPRGLMAHAGTAPVAVAGKVSAKSSKVLQDTDLSALFGFDIDAAPARSTSVKPARDVATPKKPRAKKPVRATASAPRERSDNSRIAIGKAPPKTSAGHANSGAGKSPTGTVPDRNTKSAKAETLSKPVEPVKPTKPTQPTKASKPAKPAKTA